MKKLLLILILTLNFQTLAMADSINEFEIEGISLGDSALNYFNVSTIKKNTFDYYKDKSFIAVQNDKLPFFKTYDFFDFRYRAGDKKYFMQSISGIIDFKNKDFSECLQLKEKIVDEIKLIIPSMNIEEFDKTPSRGTKGYYYQTSFFSDEGNISIICYDYLEEDNYLAVSISNKNYENFITNNPYE